MIKRFIQEATGVVIIIVVVYILMVVRNFNHNKIWDFNLFREYNRDDTLVLIVFLILSVVVRNILLARKKRKLNRL